MEIKTNVILQGNALICLKELPDESVDMVMTSPPYWCLRAYGTQPQLWDIQEGCEHEWIEHIESARGGEGKNSIVGANKETEANNRGHPTISNFCQKCNAWKGELGLEPTFELYIKHLCIIFDEVKRVLKKEGTCWVNLGDTYYGGGNNRGGSEENLSQIQFGNRGARGQLSSRVWDYKNYTAKCLCMIPFRFAIEMVNRCWILRNTLIWHKPNCMPSSVKDRFTVDFEYLFFFVKSKKYFFETQYEPITSESTIERYNYNFKGNKMNADRKMIGQREGKAHLVPYSVQPREKELIEYRNLPNLKQFSIYISNARNLKGVTIEEVESYFGNQAPHHWFNAESFPSKEDYVKLKEYLFLDNTFDKALTTIFTKSSEKRNVIEFGRNKRTVWKIPTQPFPEAHFATFPEYLCEVPIKAGCPIGGIVLDPFFGSGTTGLVALKQNKKFIGIELNENYIKIAQERLKPFLEQKKL